MNIVFRTDASIEIGTGHVMRCLTLADALTLQGHHCEFICRAHVGHLGELIQSKGYTFHLLPLADLSVTATQELSWNAHAPWLGTSWQQDADQTLALLKQQKVDWLVVDHYALDHQWERRVQAGCHRLMVMVMDDLADRAHQCDLLLDQTYGREPKDYEPLVLEHCEILCGSQYALLRPEFAQWREYSLKRRADAELKQLLINLGGVDKDNVTGTVLDALQICTLPDDCRIVIVMGATAPWLEQVRLQAQKLPWKTEVKVGVTNMAQLMADSDLAIGAAGSTTWERCCLGLPTIMLVLAANQKKIADQLVTAGAAIEADTQKLPLALEKLNAELTASELVKLANCSAIVCDGYGANRVVQQMTEIKKMHISFLCSDADHPVNEYLQRWIEQHEHQYRLELVRSKEDLSGGDLLFLISCSQIITAKDRSQYKKSLVLHASDLPLGRGWSPHVWEIIKGAEQITLTLLEAEDQVDSGDIWKKIDLPIPKHFLYDEINSTLFSAELELIDFAVKHFYQVDPKQQDPVIEPTYYPKRSPQDSEIDPYESLVNQFDKLRVCDPKRFPAFFKLHGKKYKISLEKIDE